MAVPPSTVLGALRSVLESRSPRFLSRELSGKDLLEIVKEAEKDQLDREHDDYMGDDQ